MNPFRDFTCRAELGERVQRALMTREDWHELIVRFLDDGPRSGAESKAATPVVSPSAAASSDASAPTSQGEEK